MSTQPPTDAQQQWLQQRLKRGTRSSASTRIVRQPRDRPLPLSFAQQRLWFLSQLEPESTAYLMSSAFRMNGPLVLSALEESLRFLVQRQEALRTTFFSDQGNPVQVIASEIPVGFSVHDLQAMSQDEQNQEVAHRIDSEAHQPFDLTVGPLFRFGVLKLGPENHIFLLTFHHIISDGWSMQVFFRELAIVYTAVCAGQTPSLPELPIHYADFAVWQRQYLQGAALDRQLNYWRGQLQEPLPSLTLPTDFPRPAVQMYQGGLASFQISPEITAGLENVSKRARATLFMTLLAAFQLLLQRLAGQDSICVGVPSAGRIRLEIHDVLGFFINTLVVRSELGGNPRFTDLLEQVRGCCLNAYDHQDLPFEKLVEVLQPVRDLSRTPFFQVFFNMMPGSTIPFTLPGLAITPVPKTKRESKFDLTVYLQESEEQVMGYLVYNTTLFHHERIETMVAQYQQLLQQIVAHPEWRIQHYSLLTDDSLTILPNPSLALDPPSYESIPASVRAWAIQTPHQVAVSYGSRTLSYGDLLSCGEICGKALRQQGVRQGDIVAIRGPRSIGFITTMLGVWLAGGVVLTLDPRLPRARQAFMWRRSAARVLVQIGSPDAHEGQASDPDDLPAPHLMIEPCTGTIVSSLQGEEENEWALPELPQDGPAYIFFTSGTTGTPKGILGSHQSLAHFLAWQRDTFKINPKDRIAQFTGLSFDVVLRELFLPLTSGATVCLPPEEGSGPENLAWVATEEITALHLVPSVGSFWLTRLTDLIPLPSLRWIFFAGEPLRSELLDRWSTTCPGPTKFVNLYGPTETTLAKSWYLVPADRPLGVQPLGQSLPYSQILILGDDHRRCGIGEVGEIVIRTPFRSLGYLHETDDTPKRFVPNPFQDDPADILYHTGDLGRYRPDGLVEILGRHDDQVKIRGVRIEPQEVSSVLGACPDVQACTVLASPDSKGEMTLTAYIVPHPHLEVTGSAVRTYLSGRVPSALVPTQYVLLEQLPLTPNGKIDRQALRALTPEETPVQAYTGPRTATEEKLTAIWQDVLQRERIGVHDNFFELGGHSLLATQIMSRVREAFAASLPPRTLFEAPTVAELAGALDERQERSSVSALPPIQPLSPDSPCPLSFSQERMWFLYQFAPRSAAYNIPWGFHFNSHVDMTALERAVNELRRRHDVLRTVFPSEDGQPVPQIHPFTTISVPIVDLQDSSEITQDAEVRRVAMEEAQRPFDMAQGPLMRATLVRIRPDHVLVLLTLHHIVADGWSAGIVRHELETLYEAFSKNQPSPLLELPIQYQDYAAWQRGWLQGKILETQLAYWKDHLAGAPLVLDLPTDRPRPPYQTFVGNGHSVELSRPLAMGLSQLNQRQGTTLFMTLLAILSIQLGRYTARDDLLVGSPIANRHFLAVENLIGTFVNTLVLRTKLTGNPSFLSLLRQVRQTTLEAYAHQDLPFELLVEALHPPRDLSRSPVFQVMLTVHNFVHAHRSQHQIVKSSGIERQAAQFDLSVVVIERPDHQHRIAWRYNTDLFDHSTIVRMSSQFLHLLEEIVTRPTQRIQELLLLPEAERNQLLMDWNATKRLFQERQGCLPELLDARVSKQPDAVAVVFEEHALTYGALHVRANQLAHYLRARGVGPEERVAVYCERSLDLLVALWGIVKAGGAYVPIDPTYPTERVAYMLDDASVSVVVAQQCGLPPLPAPSAQVVWLDADREAIAQESISTPETRLVPANLAYMIYTSGSTGHPKGVQVPHGCVRNFLEAMRQAPGLTVADRLLAVTSLSFDIAGLELWGPLLVGGTVVLASHDLAADGAELMTCLQRQGITVMQATPATWHLLLAAGWTGQAGLRLFCGGEQVSPDLARELLERSQCVWNLYGPTETTVWSTSCCLASEDTRVSIGRPIANTQVSIGHPIANTQVSIGRPIANTQVYLEDRWGHLAPIGVPGELLIGGDGVARGYWQRPDITAEHFGPDPYSVQSGRRRYRTGDLVRARYDGQLEWQARLDHQIKLRGYRIELGEVETAIRKHPGVHEAVVLIRKDRIDDRQLVAYVRMESEQEFDQLSLHEMLQRQIPAYMVPTVFVHLKVFPLTPNGKIDRKAFPAPDDDRPGIPQSFVPPATPTEQTLAEIWASVLGIVKVGRDDNFFALGGHSLLATKVMTRIRTKLHIDVPLRTLFEQPTVRGLAHAVKRTLYPVVTDAKTEDVLSGLLDDLDSLSDEEAQALLEQEQHDKHGSP